MESFSAFGGVLRAIRDALGISQAQLAARLGSTQRHLSFLETGRSQPSRLFVNRISIELNLSGDQRATLFLAAGFSASRTPPAEPSPEYRHALDLVEREALGNWPYPAMLLDPMWQIIRTNPPARRMLCLILGQEEPRCTLLELFQSPNFFNAIRNWEEVRPVIYFRLQANAARHPEFAPVFEQMKQTEFFAGIGEWLVKQTTAPIYMPLEMSFPGYPTMKIMPIVGKVAAVQDAVFERYEIEYLVPSDQITRETLVSLFGSP